VCSTAAAGTASFIVELGFGLLRHVCPEDSTFRWELETTQQPISVGRVTIEPGDWVVGDEDEWSSCPID
jgi:regulator of RNase E activity RraA